MRIAYIGTGAAGMLCGTCLHDNTLAAAQQKIGHDAALIPTYTPIRTDEENVSIDRIFYGGLNVYLQYKFDFFRHTPLLVDNLLNNRTLLKWLSRFSSTNAKELGALTISMLKGEQGDQRKELQKLVTWLRDAYRPDIVHLGNSLILGFASEMKRQLGVPVVCSVQGEDLFIGEMIEPFQSQALDLLRKRARDADGIIATSNYYAEHMAGLLDIDREKVSTVYLGINLSGHGPEAGALADGPFTIGYLARICPEKGLHLLLDAFHLLRQKLGPGKLQLKIAGYLGKKDEPYFRALQHQVVSRGLKQEVEYIGEIDRLEKIIYLNRLHVFSVPTVYPEAKGLFVLEALANGVPVVQPNHGSFPEMIAMTGGGVLTEPTSVESLAAALEMLYHDKGQREKLGRRGKQAVHTRFSDIRMAEETVAVYQRVLRRAAAEPQTAALPRLEV